MRGLVSRVGAGIADAVVSDSYHEGLVLIFTALRATSFNTDGARHGVRKGMLDGVSQELVYDQPARKCHLDREATLFHFSSNGNTPMGSSIHHMPHNRTEEIFAVYTIEVLRLEDTLVNRRNSVDSLLYSMKACGCQLVIDTLGGEIHDAEHHLKVVFHPVKDLSDQLFSLAKPLLEEEFPLLQFVTDRYLPNREASNQNVDEYRRGKDEEAALHGLKAMNLLRRARNDHQKLIGEEDPECADNEICYSDAKRPAVSSFVLAVAMAHHYNVTPAADDFHRRGG